MYSSFDEYRSECGRKLGETNGKEGKMDLQKLREMLEAPSIEWVAKSGIRPELIEERHVRMVMPVAGHLNHVNTMYAGSIFVLAEMSAGALFFAAYGTDDFAPVVRKADIQYTRPALGDICVDARLTKEEADAKLAPVLERGRGDLFLEVVVRDLDGNECARANINLYCLPLKK
jgi:thioesterase domain-containing protein